MKINNTGWGYMMMFLFMGILITFLIIVWLTSYRVFENLDYPSDNYNQITDNQFYKDLEEKLKVSAKAFVEIYEYNCYLPSCRVEYSQVKQTNLITDFNDIDNDKECAGYVIFNEETYKSYIKCENYETEGY